MARAIRSFATGLLLLSSAPFRVARSSFVFDGHHQVSPDGALEAIRGRIEREHVQTWKEKYLPSATTGTLKSVPVGDEIHPYFLALFPNVAPHASAVNSRGLQESACADGTSSIDVSSTVFPLLDSCMIPIEVDGDVSYGSSTGFIVYLEATSSTDSPSWFAVYETSTGDMETACIALEDADEVDPSEATWYCDLNDDGSLAIPADEQFSITCGCGDESPSSSIDAPTPMTASPAPPPTVQPAVSTIPPAAPSRTIQPAVWTASPVVPPPTAQPAASTVSPVSSSPVSLPTTQTAVSTTSPVSTPRVPSPTTPPSVSPILPTTPLVPSPTAQPSVPTMSPAAPSPTARPEASTISPVAPSPISQPAASPTSRVLPAPVMSPTSPTSQPVFSLAPPAPPVAPPTAPVTAEPASTPAPSPATGTKSPVTNDDGDDDTTPTTSVANTCADDGSFTITANADPALNGCFQDTGDTNDVDGAVLYYSVSGTMTDSEIGVLAFLTDDGDLKWYILYNPAADTDGTDDYRFYCVSVESASIVDPGDASWMCDFLGLGTYSFASEADIFIECGSCTTSTTTPPVSVEDTSAAGKLSAGIIAAGGAGFAAAASAYYSW